MNYSIFYSDSAVRDVKEALEWYNSQGENLDSYFLEALKNSEKTILSAPKSFQIRYLRKFRAFPISKFPYLVIYVLSEQTIYVVAIFNTHRNPKFLRKRIRGLK